MERGRGEGRLSERPESGIMGRGKVEVSESLLPERSGLYLMVGNSANNPSLGYFSDCGGGREEEEELRENEKKKEVRERRGVSFDFLIYLLTKAHL